MFIQLLTSACLPQLWTRVCLLYAVDECVLSFSCGRMYVDLQLWTSVRLLTAVDECVFTFNCGRVCVYLQL